MSCCNAKSNNETMRDILDRRRHRAYTTKPLTQQQLDTVLEAALQAPTARNLQSCQVIGVTDPTFLREINEEVAKALGRDDFSFSYNAPAFFFVLGDKSNRWSEVDGGIVVENMALAAQSLGLGSCIIGMIRDFMNTDRGARWMDRIGAAPNHKFVIGLSVGNPVDQPDAKPRDASRVKML